MLKGKKVGLRSVEREDLPLLRDWRNIPDFRRHFREFRELNMAMQEKWFQRVVVDSPNDFMFTIVAGKNRKPVGVCGLVYIDWRLRSADISLYIGEGEGYIDKGGMAEDAARVLMAHGFDTLNLHKLWTELYVFDERKIEMFGKRLGFKRDAVLRDNCFEDGKYHDSYIYSLLEGDYRKNR